MAPEPAVVLRLLQRQVLSAQADGSDLRVEADVPGQPADWVGCGRPPAHRVHARPQDPSPRTDGTLVTHADLDQHAAGHLNDMVVDDEGRAYVSNFGFDFMGGAPVEPTALHRVDPDGAVTPVATTCGSPTAV